MGTFVRKEAVRCSNGLLQVYRALRGRVKLPAGDSIRFNHAGKILWRSEFRNILAYYCRRGSLSYRQSVQVCRRAEILMKG